MRKCPFCKSEIDNNIDKCPICLRVLIEKISHNLPIINHDNNDVIQGKVINDKRKKGKINLKKYKNIFYGIIIIFLISLIYLTSTENTENHTPTNNIYTKNNVNTYINNFKNINDKISENVKGVARLTGQSRDKEGRLVDNYVYNNKDLNITLFENKWTDTNQQFSDFNIKIDNFYESDINNFFNYFKTSYFFIVNELWFRAFDNNDNQKLETLYNHIENTVKDNSFNKYLTQTNNSTSTTMLLESLKISRGNAKLESEINAVDSYLNNCVGLSDCPDYNIKVDKYNNLIETLNIRSKNEEELFTKFMDLVEAYLLFPGQNTIEQTTEL